MQAGSDHVRGWESDPHPLTIKERKTQGLKKQRILEEASLAGTTSRLFV